RPRPTEPRQKRETHDIALKRGKEKSTTRKLFSKAAKDKLYLYPVGMSLSNRVGSFHLMQVIEGYSVLTKAEFQRDCVDPQFATLLDTNAMKDAKSQAATRLLEIFLMTGKAA